MDNPWLILIVLVPSYVVVSLIAALFGASIAPLLRLPRSRFWKGFGISFVTAPVALILYVVLLGMLSIILPSTNAVIHGSSGAESLQLYHLESAPAGSQSPTLSLNTDTPFVFALNSDSGEELRHTGALPAEHSPFWFPLSLAITLCLALVAAFTMALHGARNK